MRNILRLSLVGALLLTSSVAGLSQTASPPSAATQAAQAGKQGTSAAEATAALREKLFAVAVKQTTPIFEGKAVELALQIKKAPQFTAGVNKDEVSVSGVSAEGFSQYVMHDGKKIGQAVLTRLTKGERYVELNAENFSSQFNVEEDVINPEETLDVSGNEQELIAALKKLNSDEAPADDKEKSGEEKEEDYRDVARDENGGSGSGGSPSGGGETPGSSGYETPERKDVEKAETPEEDPEEVRVTYDGCSPVIDRNQGQVRVQSKTQTLKKGIVVEESACSDSGTNFTIQKSAATCEDKIDLNARIAKPQFLEYYINSQQERIQLSDCQPDPDTTFRITEADTCPIDVNLEEGKAYVETSLVYTDGNNNLQTVRTCERSESVQPIQMTQVADGCNILHDFGNALSTEMAMWMYERDGQFYQASPCTQTDKTFKHEKVFKKNGVDICQTMVDLTGRRAIPQYRNEIVVDGAPQYIDQCTPDSNTTINILATSEGCMNPAEFNHDIAAGVSYGLERHYYENPLRVYVNSCQQSKTAYTHDVEISSWKYNDEKKVAQPLSDVSINVSGQVYPIASNMLLPGAPEFAYTSLGEETEQKPGGRYFEGCYGFIPTKLTDVFERPDGTRLEIDMGAGAPYAEGYQCKSTTEGCMNPNDFIHDFTSGYSYGLQRFYYNNPDRNYVGSCEKGDNTFNHNVETTDWQNNDARLKAKPLSDVWIRVEGANHTIAQTMLMPGAAEVAYNLTHEEDVPRAGDATIDGCNKTVPSTLMKTYERPDGSEYVKNAGAGSGVVSDVCTRVTERKTTRKTTYYSPRVPECATGFITNEYEKEEYRTRTKITYPDGKVEYTSWKNYSNSKLKKSLVRKNGSRSNSDEYC
ncbi:hypothetical protein [Pseudovibrio brasiliensis]|uniref:Uncharacterized protein n=1 Tax=Pseudovibrio brasiliensis TaxID=1898042 RepID=A0ABX8AV90_9HYPH|nr:hypothetical protein [Pseudovibrio brasiliensis]QUS58985.1 hypothetical protein KGB56_26155 [Pseudovibrio brasiliensis]